MQTIFQAFFGSLGVAVPTSAQCWRWPQFYIQLGLATFEKINYTPGKAMKSSPLLGPFCGSEFWGFSLLKI